MTPKKHFDKNGQDNDGDRHLPKKIQVPPFLLYVCMWHMLLFKIPGVVSSQVKKFLCFVGSAQTEETSHV
jgi:hypothetical protein